jgi:CDP-6-deoxy-D-xylo-4-hexulose-3-dehydrase
MKLDVGDLVSIGNKSSASVKDVIIGVVYQVWEHEIQFLSLSSEKLDFDYVCIENDDLIEGELCQKYFINTEKQFLAKIDSVLSKLGKINVKKMDEIIRNVAYHTVEKHYLVVHKRVDEFVEGQTYVRYAGRVYDSEEMKALLDSCLDFWLTSGRFAKQFEREFASFMQRRYCILTNSGSSANLLAISALTSKKLGERRLNPGDEILTTACAFPTTINPIVQNNLIPVFLDVDLGTYNIQADKVETALTDKTKAIICAHTLGNPFDLEIIQKICAKYNLWLIEDNCDALGSSYDGRLTGTFGEVATFSFYPPHHMTMGEGGALVTNDAHLKTVIESFRDWGRDCWCEPGSDNTCNKRFKWQLGTLPYGYDHKYVYSHIGYNLKITDMQAAVGTAQLKKLPHFINARKKNWQLLYKGLKKYEKYFVLPEATKKADPSWFGFVLTVKEDAPFTRNDITAFLEKNNVATRLLFSGNIVRHPSFEGVKYRVFGKLENTDFIMNKTFWIGVYPGLTESMINYVLDMFANFMKSPVNSRIK